jgi:CheY-like chemotaxis protein
MQKTVLVVDDDPIYVELVKDLLDMHQCTVLAAYNGKEALTILLQNQIDVIVSDIEMPSLNGIEFHKRISEDATLRDIPFIFLTGSEESFYRQYVAEHPSTKLIRKTEMVECLLPCISDILLKNG